MKPGPDPVHPPQWFAELLPKLSPLQVSQLYQHYEILERWNARMSLTTVRPGPERVERHYLESLHLAENLPKAQAIHSLADIGSGAGFPGVPLAVVMPDCEVTLIESNQRKGVFLREACRHIKNLRIAAERAEKIGSRYDWIVSRAVDPKDVVRLLPRMSDQVALMIGDADVATLNELINIAWDAPIQLPWGDHRVLAIGRFMVPRGT